MTYTSAPTKARPTLYLAALFMMGGWVFATVFFASVIVATATHAPLGLLTSSSLVGLFLTVPVAVVASLFVRCQACDKLVLPLVYDGKRFFSKDMPNALAIGGTAVSIILRRQAACPHCGTETHV